MDLKNQNGVEVQGNKNAKEGATGIPASEAKKSTNANGLPVNQNGNPANGPVKQQLPNEEPLKAANETAPRKVEEGKPVKIGLNLESTLKVVEDLHRRSIQRVNLIARIKQLEAFEVTLTTESDELEENPYQGCKLIIEDDKQRRFVTTTPGLSRLVAQFIFDACHEKLADIEAHIILPNA